jgi:tellurite resistance protein TerC
LSTTVKHVIRLLGVYLTGGVMAGFPLYVWIGFIVFVVLMLALDLGVFQRKAHEIKFKEAVIWSVFWISLALIFNLGIYLFDGKEDALAFLTGYIIEKSLSVDNLFVFLMVFTFFKVPKKYQHKILFWGVLGAIVLRAIFIFAGIALIERFEFMIYIFGLFLVFTGIKMGVQKETHIEPENNIILRIFKKLFPVTTQYDDGHFFTKKGAKRYATPMFVVLLVVESSDLVFAVDSIPAIIAVTRNPFIVFTSNIFAILGLRALYFALASFVDRFYYLKHALSVILVYVGIKMLVSHFYKIPTGLSLLIIILLLTLAVICSMLREAKEKRKGV